MCYETHLKLCFGTSDVFDNTPWLGLKYISRCAEKHTYCILSLQDVYFRSMFSLIFRKIGCWKSFFKSIITARFHHLKIILLDT